MRAHTVQPEHPHARGTAKLEAVAEQSRLAAEWPHDARSCCEGHALNPVSVRLNEKFEWNVETDDTGYKWSRELRAAFSLVECCVAAEPGEFLGELEVRAMRTEEAVVSCVACPTVEDR